MASASSRKVGYFAHYDDFSPSKSQPSQLKHATEVNAGLTRGTGEEDLSLCLEPQPCPPMRRRGETRAMGHVWHCPTPTVPKLRMFAFRSQVVFDTIYLAGSSGWVAE